MVEPWTSVNRPCVPDHAVQPKYGAGRTRGRYGCQGGSITHTEGAFIFSKTGLPVNRTVNNNTHDQHNRRRYDDSASSRVISCRGLNPMPQCSSLHSSFSRNGPDAAHTIERKPYFVLQCSAMCHALQSMRCGLYSKDRVGSSLMGSTATWSRTSGQRQSQNCRSIMER